MRFIIAIAIGAAYEAWSFVRERSAGLWLSLTGQVPRVPPKVYQARMEVCRQCPVFYAPLRTCGSPLRRGSRVRNHPAGCSCYMPFKAKFECNCWLWEEIANETLPPQYWHWTKFGWKGPLNSDYAEE